MLHAFERDGANWRSSGTLSVDGLTGPNPGCGQQYGYCGTDFGIAIAVEGDWMMVGKPGRAASAGGRGGRGTPQPAEPEMAPINLSTYVQPEEFIQPERTSELYNFLSTELSKLNDLIYSNHGQFSDDEYRSLCGTAYHIYINLRTKCDHLERLERNRTESFTVDATQV